MKTYSIRTMEALAEAATDVLSTLRARKEGSRPVFVGLTGDLGTGKTTFIQTLARLLSIDEIVTSPTFIIMKRYPVATPPFRTLVHIDAYRLESSRELAVLGFTDLLDEDDALVCIEWPERIQDLMPNDTIMLTFALDGEDNRTLTISYAEKN